MYQIHPSKRLKELFEHRPYQGANPLHAKFLFIGLDANYAESIEQQLIFSQIIEYHQDGVLFWQKYGIHHPFLLPNYKGDGKRFHQNFAKIGFSTANANDISFIELLHLPTFGRNLLSLKDLSHTHLNFLYQAMFRGNAKYIFITPTILALMRKIEIFNALKKPISTDFPLKTFYQDEHRTVFQHLHFSNYGKFQQQMTVEAKAIFDLTVE